MPGRERRVLIPPASPGERIRLPDGEARHLLRALRARSGDVVCAVDPAGNRFRATLASAGPDGAWLKIEELLSAASAFPCGPALLVAPPKGSRMAWLGEKAGELGAGAILPVETARGCVRAAGEAQTARWRRLAAAAIKQSGAQPPEVGSLRPLAEALAGLDPPLLAAHPAPNSIPFEKALAELPTGALPAFAIGPEGGWTEEELGLLEASSARFIRLGRRTLRVETAAVAVLAAWSLGARG